jgi:hypothetical protein
MNEGRSVHIHPVTKEGLIFRCRFLSDIVVGKHEKQLGYGHIAAQRAFGAHCGFGR